MCLETHAHPTNWELLTDTFSHKTDGPQVNGATNAAIENF